VEAVTYYARLAPGDTPDRPRSLVRRRHTEVYPTDEALRDDGRWHPTDLLERASVGDLDDEMVEISAEAADRVAARWRALVEVQRRDLAAQGRGQHGMRIAASAPAGDAERLDGAERDLVARYLREAPLVVSAFGLGPDPYAGDAPRRPLGVVGGAHALRRDLRPGPRAGAGAHPLPAVPLPGGDVRGHRPRGPADRHVTDTGGNGQPNVAGGIAGSGWRAASNE
jgi:hypothetical protein